MYINAETATGGGFKNLKTNIFRSFTLSEVLITLAIIGVVSAITIPMVIANIQKQENVEKLKKADSVLRQSILKISVKEGAPVGDFSFMQNDDFFNSFIKEVDTVKVCQGNVLGCFTNNSIKRLNGKNYGKFNRSNSLITNDGIAYGWDSRYCSGKGITVEDQENCIGRFIIDINGERSPNQFGIDVFFFTVVDKKGIVPAGSGNNSSDCSRKSDGIMCAAKVLQEGRISY